MKHQVSKYSQGLHGFDTQTRLSRYACKTFSQLIILEKDEHNLWIILQLINFLFNNIKVKSSSVIFTYKYCIAIVDDKEIFAY